MSSNAEQILQNRSASNLLIEDGKRSDIVIAAPHHTIGGVKNMPCPEHTDGDENTGIIAYKLAEALEANLIIACNYQVDPNKDIDTEYSRQIIKWQPKVLIEIHGHGARKINDDIIEVSSGNKEHSKYSSSFASSLESKLKQYSGTEHYKVNGDFETLYFKASKTATIIDSRWISFHIELPPSLRLGVDNSLPPIGNNLIESLIETIRIICKN